jgi:hypothetical protein
MSKRRKENPYDPSRPATPGVFVGRETQKRALLNGLPNGRVFELIGGAGLGKTSLLHAVQRELRARQTPQKHGPVQVPVYVSCPRAPVTAGMLFKEISKGLAEALNQQCGLACDLARSHKAEAEAADGRLEAALTGLLEWAFAQTRQGHEPLLLLDDLHRAGNGAGLNDLVSVLQTLLNQRHWGLVLASRDGLAGEWRNDVSPLRMLISQQLTLAPLTRRESRALVGKAAEFGWTVEPGSANLAHDLTQGHPYRLHWYLSGALNTAPKLTLAGLRAQHTPAAIASLERLVGQKTAEARPAAAARRPLVFVSYSRKDEAEKEKLLSHLGVLGNAAELLDVWSDDRISAGADWEREIEQAIAQARVAIMLISDHFLNSNFIREKEVPAMLQRRQQGGLTLFPVIAKACAWRTVPWLAGLNAKPKNGDPVWRDDGQHVDKELAKIAQELVALLRDGCIP